MITLYGIPNCDTVKKARKWLEGQSVEYAFHDFRADGAHEKLFKGWLEQVSSIELINCRSTTWRQLSDEQCALLESGEGIDLLVEFPTLIKRPVLERDGVILSIGFKEEQYSKLFK